MIEFHDTGECPIRSIISRLGDKWTLLVLLTLQANGTMRFNELHHAIGDVSHRMLTVTLRKLEADGLLARVVHPEVPPKVEYNLTETGQSLLPSIESLVDWALQHRSAITTNRQIQR